MKRRYMRMVRRIFRSLRHPRIRRSRMLSNLTQRIFERDLWKPCRHSVAGGVSVGMFFAFTHLPLQSLVAAFVAMRLRLNVPFAIAITWISNPLTTPAIWILQHELGVTVRELLGFSYPAWLTSRVIHLWHWTINFGEGFLDVVLGALLSGMVLGLLAYPFVQLVARFIPHHHLPHRREPGQRSLAQQRVRARRAAREAAGRADD